MAKINGLCPIDTDIRTSLTCSASKEQLFLLCFSHESTLLIVYTKKMKQIAAAAKRTNK